MMLFYNDFAYAAAKKKEQLAEQMKDLSRNMDVRFLSCKILLL